MSSETTDNISTKTPVDTIGTPNSGNTSPNRGGSEYRSTESSSGNESGTMRNNYWEPALARTDLSGLCGFFASPELKKISKNWFPFMLLGITLLLLGFLAIGASFFVTILTVAVLGVLLMIGGTMQVVNSFCAGHWSGFLLHIALGLLYIVVGFILLDAPLVNAIALTFLLAAFLMVAGLFRMIAALSIHMPCWGWTLFNGIVTFLLGVLIYKHWPSSGLWVIGLFVGIEMVFAGWYWIMFASGLRATARIEQEEERAMRRAAPQSF
ncbi:MAG: HdeD family acid-resistance protein [Planctomycetia bacterium]|nr:HdeD family acid-resistance protein [Planctomycetia bacterium]